MYQLRYHFPLFLLRKISRRFASNICLEYKSRMKTFSLGLDLWNCLNKSFPFSTKLPPEKIFQFKFGVLEQLLLRVGCVQCIKMWKSYDGVNRETDLRLLSFGSWKQHAQIFQIVIGIYMISKFHAKCEIINLCSLNGKWLLYWLIAGNPKIVQ